MHDRYKYLHFSSLVRAPAPLQQRRLLFQYSFLLNVLDDGLGAPHAFRDVVYTLLRDMETSHPVLVEVCAPQ